MSPRARFLAALLALLGWAVLVTHVRLGLERHPQASLWQEIWRTARYFTILTNALAAGTLTAVGFGWRPPAGWAAGLALWMGITGVVYHALLAMDLTGLRWWTDQGLHTAGPLALFLWWLGFAPKSGLRWRHALLWVGWPALYMGYALIRGGIDGRHPYFFLDPPRLGWEMVLVWIAALGLLFWLSGLAMVALGRALSRARPPRADGALAGPPPQ
jgi:hypothetical protein